MAFSVASGCDFRQPVLAKAGRCCTSLYVQLAEVQRIVVLTDLRRWRARRHRPGEPHRSQNWPRPRPKKPLLPPVLRVRQTVSWEYASALHFRVLARLKAFQGAACGNNPAQ